MTSGHCVVSWQCVIFHTNGTPDERGEALDTHAGPNGYTVDSAYEVATRNTGFAPLTSWTRLPIRMRCTRASYRVRHPSPHGEKAAAGDGDPKRYTSHMIGGKRVLLDASFPLAARMRYLKNVQEAADDQTGWWRARGADIRPVLIPGS